MKRFKRFLGVGLVAGLALSAVGVIAGSPAGATVKVTAINCSAGTPFGPLAVRNPSVSHVTGPVWAAQSSAATLTTQNGMTVLPRVIGPATVGSFQDLVNKSQIVGSSSTVVEGLTFNVNPLLPNSTTVAVAGPWLYDPDLADNGGVPNPVPMDGATPYPGPPAVAGPFPTPTVVVSLPPALIGTPGTYDVTTTLDPGAGTLPTGTTPGNPGAMLLTPDVDIDITDTGTDDVAIDVVATSTALTANIIAPLAFPALTTCAPDTTPTHTVNVQTDGDPAVEASPLVACKPSAATGGQLSDSKGWWSNTTDSILSAAEAGNVATYTTSLAHGLKVGNLVTVSGMTPTGYNVTQGTVATVPSATTFTLPVIGPLVAGGAGTVTQITNAGGSLKSTALAWGGCNAPDTKLNAWVAAKTGALAADAGLLDKASIAVKGKHFGDCTEVLLRGPGGDSYGGQTAGSYPIYGTIAAKWLAGTATSKVKASTGVVGANIVIDSSAGSPARAYFEAKGTVSKGTGVGGSMYMLAELNSADPQVLGVIACNSIGYAPPTVGAYYGAAGLGMDISTGDDAVISVTLP